MLWRRVPGEIPFEAIIVNFGFPVKILICILRSSQIIKIMRVGEGEITEEAVVEDMIPTQCNCAVSKSHPGKVVGKDILSGIAGEEYPVPLIDRIIQFAI